MSENNQVSCAWCKRLFKPTRKNHTYCSNKCNVFCHQRREKVRSLLMKLSTPEQLVAMELFAETMADGEELEHQQ